MIHGFLNCLECKVMFFWKMLYNKNAEKAGKMKK